MAQDQVKAAKVLHFPGEEVELHIEEGVLERLVDAFVEEVVVPAAMEKLKNG